MCNHGYSSSLTTASLSRPEFSGAPATSSAASRRGRRAAFRSRDRPTGPRRRLPPGWTLPSRRPGDNRRFGARLPPLADRSLDPARGRSHTRGDGRVRTRSWSRSSARLRWSWGGPAAHGPDGHRDRRAASGAGVRSAADAGGVDGAAGCRAGRGSRRRRAMSRRRRGLSRSLSRRRAPERARLPREPFDLSRLLGARTLALTGGGGEPAPASSSSSRWRCSAAGSGRSPASRSARPLGAGVAAAPVGGC